MQKKSRRKAEEQSREETRSKSVSSFLFSGEIVTFTFLRLGNSLRPKFATEVSAAASATSTVSQVNERFSPSVSFFSPLAFHWL